METVSVQPGITRQAQLVEVGSEPATNEAKVQSKHESTPPTSITSPRLRVTLPGREGASVTWEELAELEKTHGVEVVRKWLKGGNLSFPVEPSPPKSKAFIKHMTNLKRLSEQREYSRMMEGVTQKGSHLSMSMTSISPEHTGVGASGFQMSVIGLNMVVGIGCAFVGADYLGRQYGLTPMQRTGVSLTAMIFVMVLEMVLFIIRSSRFDQLDQMRRKAKEGTLAPAVGLNLDFSQLAELTNRTNASGSISGANKKTD